MRSFALACALSLSCLAPAFAAAPAKAPDDPRLWLEDVTGTRALQWVAQRDSRARRRSPGPTSSSP